MFATIGGRRVTSHGVRLGEYDRRVLRLRTEQGVDVVGALRHQGAARHAMHRFKYDADLGAGRTFATAMSALADATWGCLVPVPRAVGRRLRYGVDPSAWLATEMGRLLGIPVVRVVTAGVWWPSRGRGASGTPQFACRRPPPSGSVLVDDVVTTGTTIDSAAALVGARRAVVASVAVRAFGPDSGVAYAYS